MNEHRNGKPKVLPEKSSRESVKKTAVMFEEKFRDSALYDLQTRDTSHRDFILSRLALKEEGCVLDLGTGTGFLAFALALENPGSDVYGLDIVEETIGRNARKAEEKKLNNLHFISYDGFSFPFQDSFFDVAVTRYALHHFPDIRLCFRELNRILKAGGQLFISDPSPNDTDKSRFVDRYMQMKDDGHIRFYTEDEWKTLALDTGFSFQSSTATEIRFSRTEPEKYRILLRETEQSVLDSYQISVTEEEIFISEKILNISFRKL
jgi:ubiquinone/menaquinone biosynthesis C-methylase UbiE